MNLEVTSLTKAEKHSLTTSPTTPLTLKKIGVEENGEATVIFYTSDNDLQRKLRSYPKRYREVKELEPNKIVTIYEKGGSHS